MDSLQGSFLDDTPARAECGSVWQDGQGACIARMILKLNAAELRGDGLGWRGGFEKRRLHRGFAWLRIDMQRFAHRELRSRVSCPANDRRIPSALCGDLRVRSGEFPVMEPRGLIVCVSSLLWSRKQSEMNIPAVDGDLCLPFAAPPADAFEA